MKKSLDPLTPHSSSVQMLSEILPELYDKNQFPLIGNATYKKYTGHFGHVELEITTSDINTGSFVEFNVSENQIPEEFRPSIIKALNNFLLIFYTNRANSPVLKFRILAGSYSTIDSKASDFEIATYLAIQSAFR